MKNLTLLKWYGKKEKLKNYMWESILVFKASIESLDINGKNKNTKKWKGKNDKGETYGTQGNTQIETAEHLLIE